MKNTLSQVAPSGMNGITLSNEPNSTWSAMNHAKNERIEEDTFSHILSFKGSTHMPLIPWGGLMTGINQEFRHTKYPYALDYPTN